MSLFDTFLPINGLNNVVNSAGNVVRDALGIGATKTNGSAKSSQDIDGFKGEVLGKGNADQNRFEMMVNLPKCLAGTEWSKYALGANYRVEHVTFPSLSLIVKSRKTFGAPMAMPTGINYGGTIAVTYVCDRDMNTKKLFDAWMGSIVDYDTQTVAYQSEYTTKIEFSQLDRSDWIVYTVNLEDAFPIAISDMQGSMNSPDFQRFQVMYAYRRWKCNEVVASASSAATTQIGKTTTLSDQMNKRITSLQGIASKYGMTMEVNPIQL